ncbi:MAG: hypothetical protein J0L97_05935 [Alphaproteobacteria bacterium]|nr:hypothetical protein [Alphaproteobacteria bacterium]
MISWKYIPALLGAALLLYPAIAGSHTVGPGEGVALLAVALGLLVGYGVAYLLGGPLVFALVEAPILRRVSPVGLPWKKAFKLALCANAFSRLAQIWLLLLNLLFFKWETWFLCLIHFWVSLMVAVFFYRYNFKDHHWAVPRMVLYPHIPGGVLALAIVGYELFLKK